MQAEGAPETPTSQTLFRRAAVVLCLAVGLLVVGVGQYAVGNRTRGIGPIGPWPGLGWLDARYTEIFVQPNALAFATPLFLIGAALFGAAALASGRREPPAWRVPGLRSPPLWCAVPVVVLASVLLWMIVSLFLGRFSTWYRFIFVSAVGLMPLLLLAGDFRAGRLAVSRPRPVHLVEAAALLAIVGTFVGINAHDLENWRYAPIGDDGGFFYMARRIIDDGHLNWFSQRYGVFGVPVLGSAWNSANMLVFGSDTFGWKMGSVMSVAVTLPALYWLLRELFSARVGIFGALFLGASHYLFGYAHTGYPNLFALFPTVAALACFVSGMKRGSPALLFCSGVFAALGFYTFYTSRVTIAIIGLVLLTTWDRRLIVQTIAWIAPSFSLTVLPLFAVDHWEVVSAMMKRSYRVSDEPVVRHMTHNFVRSVLGFSYSPYHHIYTAGALQDGVSVALSYAGIGVSLAGLGRFAYRLLVIWFLAAIIVAGVLSEYSEVSISRMHYALPPMAAFAAVAVDAVITAISDLSRRSWFAGALTAILFAVLAPTVFALNGRQFFIYAAHRNPTSTATLIFRAVLDSRCQNAEGRSMVLVAEPDPILDGSFRFYNMQDKRPVQLRFEDQSAVYTGVADSAAGGCVIVADARDAAAEPLLTRFEEARGEPNPIETDLTGETKAAVFYPREREAIDATALASSWRTDFSRGSLSGLIQGQVRDFQPALIEPVSLAVEESDVADVEPVMVATVGDTSRGYAIRYLMRHHVVNDVIAGVPVLVIYDPISGVARAFDRRLDGQPLTFGLTGYLRAGNAVLYDRETETWWQSLSGDGLAGAHADRQLAPIEATAVSMARYRLLASSNAGRASMMAPPLPAVPYQHTLYVHYDVRDAKPIFAEPPYDERLRPLRRVEIIEAGGVRVAVPFPEGDDVRDSVMTVDVGERRILLLFDASTADEVDNRAMFDSRRIGRYSAYEAPPGSIAPLPGGGALYANEDGVTWSILGRTVDNSGAPRLLPVTHYTSYWFSASGIYPQLEIWR